MDRSHLKLLYFSYGYTTHDRRFLEAFVEAECDVSYLRLSDQCLDQRSLPEGVSLLNWTEEQTHLALNDPTSSDVERTVAALQHILGEVIPQVVLAGPVQTAAYLVAQSGFVPLTTMSWGSDLLVDADQSDEMRYITRYTLERSAGVLCDCQAVKTKINEFTPIDEDHIVSFPWGIDLARFQPKSSALTLRQDLGWSKNNVLISTRSWEPIYAIDVLISAFALVREQHPAVRLLLLGDGSESEKICSQIARLCLQEYIYCPGRINYNVLPEYFRMADIYVSSALSDGTSISLLEAMACGLPVVVTNGYGNVEWVKAGHNGWLVTPDDPTLLADALNEALCDMQLLSAMSQANIVLAQERADWKKNFPQLLHLLKQDSISIADTQK